MGNLITQLKSGSGGGPPPTKPALVTGSFGDIIGDIIWKLIQAHPLIGLIPGNGPSPFQKNFLLIGTAQKRISVPPM